MKRRHVRKPPSEEKAKRTLARYLDGGWTIAAETDYEWVFERTMDEPTEGLICPPPFETKTLTPPPALGKIPKPKAKLFGTIKRAPGNEWMDDPDDPRHEELRADNGKPRCELEKSLRTKLEEENVPDIDSKLDRVRHIVERVSAKRDAAKGKA